MPINFYPWKMPRLNILSFSEQKDFDSPAELSGEERKLYFRKNNTINHFLTIINSSSHKVAFALMLYHFKISKKFFPAYMFSPKDVRYIYHLFKLDDNDSKCVLGNKTFNRYKEQILEYVGYKGFDQNSKELLRSKAYSLATQYVRPKVVFSDCVDLLLEQRIEIPKYNTIRSVIVEVLHQYKNTLLELLEKHLTSETKEWLDELLIFDTIQSISKLTSLKSFNQSIKPKAIKFNTKDFEVLQKMHDRLQPILKTLPINARDIEYFATIAIKSDIFRIRRREDKDRYLHLIAFIMYQYAKLHDTLMEMWLKAISSFNSSSKREHKEQCYALRCQHDQRIKDRTESILRQNKGVKIMHSIHKKNRLCCIC